MKKLFDKVKSKNKDDEKAIRIFNMWYDELSKELLQEINLDKNEKSPILLYQFDIVNQLYLYRVLDLINEISEDCNIENYSSSILSVRASMEVTALAYDLINKIDTAIMREEHHNLEKIFFNRLFGTRHNPDNYSSINVLTAIKNVNKIHNDYLSTYEELSDYCHPSFKNLSNFYLNKSEDGNKFKLNKNYFIERFDLALINKPLFNVFDVYLDLIPLISKTRQKLREIDENNIAEN